MNFSLIHSTIKTTIRAEGFRYWEPQDWFNIEIGKLPESAIQDGFTIRFAGQDPSDLNTDNMGKITMEIEFALTARKDAYLVKMATAQTAIRGIRAALVAVGSPNSDDEIFPIFTMQYLGEIIAMTFTITFDLDSN
jgi:hypothetical protein